MRPLDLKNPLGGPVLFEETVSSTMDLSRGLAAQGFPSGTVIAADFQEAGRGRQTRPWRMERGLNLAFTLRLDYDSPQDIPAGFSLRAGLAAARAIERFAPGLAGRVLVKWPNDVMLLSPRGAKKTCGILCEADGGRLHTGIGINVAQDSFPPELAPRALSLSRALREWGEAGVTADELAGRRFSLLEGVLLCLAEELRSGDGGTAPGGSPPWQARLEERLYLRGSEVVFAEGAAGSGSETRGILEGIGPGGELLLRPAGEPHARPFVTGELLWDAKR
ncbi:MAG: biotin--[acetyl-CoA-carboxylase] ligase [Treponema sp.]|jgi:BirA family biotin operon repressor/biotin-[acetyl-CoA-carboxylase] ligase|nr:biotin--[acetyl-CoA-carboxylase] ligase [Treponema sp.]